MKQTRFTKDDIRPEVIIQLTAANKSIHLAIGWMEDDGLFGLLQKKILEGVFVKILLIQEDVKQAISTEVKQLSKQGAQLVYLGKEHKEHLIDHKFVLIDDATILTGNYAWGFKNAPVEEFLLVTEGLPTMVEGYQKEFEYLSVVNQLSKEEKKAVPPVKVLLKKLSIIKVLLKIGDTEFVHLRLDELKGLATDENTASIYKKLVNEDYKTAEELIARFIDFHRPLEECIDPPIDNLRREILRLEDEIAAISNEYSETQKSLHEFSKLHSTYLGDLLQKILLQSKIKAEREASENPEKQADFDSAKKDHEEYTESHEQSKKQKLVVLSPKEKKELKKLYRQTSLKCHPDRVIEEMHEEAEEIFVALNQAYRANDLEAVREINQQLKSGLMLAKSEGITELKKLESTVKSLSQKLESWQEKLDLLKAMPTFKTIDNIEDWDQYLEETKALLEDQLERLIKVNSEIRIEN